MKCTEFRRLYPQMVTFPRTPSPQDDKFVRHMHACEACGEWYMWQVARQRGVDPSEHPCVHIAYRISREPGVTGDAHDDPDVTLIYSVKTKRYGIPVRDGGSSYIHITHCPWCGKKLVPKRKAV
jgi:hypothetical protein